MRLSRLHIGFETLVNQRGVLCSGCGLTLDLDVYTAAVQHCGIQVRSMRTFLVCLSPSYPLDARQPPKQHPRPLTGR